MGSIRWHLLFPVLLVLLSVSPVHADEEPLTFGIFPYISPVQMVKFHNTLRERIAMSVDRPVSLVSAPNFKEFIKRTAQGEYDIIMTAPHLGRLAEVRDGYRPMVHTMHEVQGVYLVSKDSDIHTLSDLRGKTITLVGRSAIITQMVEQQLNELGMEVGKDVQFKLTRTHNNAMYAPLRGESDASVTGILIFRKIDSADRARVRVIGKTETAPGFLLMTHSRISEQVHKKIEESLLEFHKTREGKEYFNVTGFHYFDPITKDEMEFLEPYIQVFLK